jgi:hypothetical protein
MIKIKYSLIFLFLIFCINCISSFQKGNNRNIEKDDFFYFQKGIFADPSIVDNEKDGDGYHRNWYSEYLKSMKEPSLIVPEFGQKCVIRFLWLRTFHCPIAVRIEKQGDSILLHATELTGKGGYEPGKIKNIVKKDISKNDYEKISQLLIDTDFWKLPTIISAINQDGTVTVNADGARWILEVRESEKYHVVDRWSPESGKYRELCLYMLELSGLQVDSDDIY